MIFPRAPDKSLRTPDKPLRAPVRSDVSGIGGV